jgi:hypothetical protein
MKKAMAAVIAVGAAACLAGTAAGNGTAVHSAPLATDGSATSARALAARATGTWTGEFKPPAQQGSRVQLKVAVRRGKATKVKRFTYLALMQCDVSGPTPGESGWIFTPGGIKVKPNRKFRISGQSAATPRSNLTLKGRFSRNYKKVKGRFRTHQWFPAETEPEPLPAEYCDLAPTKFVAKR